LPAKVSAVATLYPMESEQGAKPITPVSLDREVSGLVERFPSAGTTLIKRAYLLAAVAHDGQFRKSGDLYITHPVAVAIQVADLGLDAGDVAAAL
jgi:(p)ppGpp synthase/HD superfamily hydrolase